MDLELERVYLQVMQARIAEDLFGAEDVVLAPSKLFEHLEKKRASLVRVLEADGYLGEDREGACEARARLEKFWADVKLRVPRNLYGLPGYQTGRSPTLRKSFRVGEHSYHLGHTLSEADGTATYLGAVEMHDVHLGEVMFKVAQTPLNNPTIAREDRILSLLHTEEIPQWKHLPIVLDRFQSQNRAGLVFRKVSGNSLSWLRSRPQHLKGLDQRDAIWMLDRTLSCLGYVHRCGIVHGTLSPDRMVFQHLSHNIVLTEWGDAVHRPALSGECVEKVIEPFSAPEVVDHGVIGPWSDIYSLGKVMIWLLGGDPKRNEIPQGVVTPLKNFLLRMVQEDRYARPTDAWALWDEENRIKDAHWERKFRALNVA